MGDKKTVKNSVDLSYEREDKDDKKQISDLPKIEGTNIGKIARTEIREVKYADIIDNKLVVFDPYGEFEIKIDKLMSDEEINNLKSDLSWGQNLYISSFVFEYANIESTYISGVSTSKTQIQKCVNRVKQIQTKYEKNIPFEFIDDDKNIRFGSEYNYKRHIPSLIDKKLPQVSYNKYLVYPIIITYILLLSTPILYGYILTAIAVMLLTILTGSIAALHRVGSETHTAVKSDIPSMYVSKYNTNNSTRVLVADIIERDNSIIIHSPEVDASWTFPKNDFGDLKGIGGKVIDESPRNANQIIIRTSKAEDTSSGIKSDCGRYIINGFDRQLDWMI